MKRCGIYARVSTTKGQDPEVQLLDLRHFARQRGWAIVDEFVDIGISGSKDRRPQLDRIMEFARKRKLDVILCWRFDRWARSTKHLVTSLEELKNLGVDFCSYSEQIDTSSPLGKAMFVIVSAVSELEKNILQERVLAGLRKARNLGKKLGRPTVKIKLAELIALRKHGLSNRAIGEKLGISKDSVRNYLKAAKNGVRKTTP